MIKVNGNLFRAAMEFASLDETRYYLNGVYIEPHETGALLIGTDGHRLVCVHDADAICERAAIVKLPPIMLRALVPPHVERSEDDDWGDEVIVSVEGHGQTLLIEASGHAMIEGVVRSASSVLIDGKYPDWRKVVGKFAETGGPFQAFNAEYLSAFARMARLLGDNANRVMFVPGAAVDTPSLILFPGTANAFGILMPTRIPENIAPRVPDFLNPKNKAA